MRAGWRRGLVGLDIGSSAVKAAELRRRGRGWALAAFGAAPLPAGAVDGGAIVDRGAVAAALRGLLKQRGFRARSAAVALAGNAVMVRRITLPAMSRAELDGSIHWEARQHIPFPAEEVTLDYQVLGAPAEAESGNEREVLLVAARNDRAAAYADVVEQAGCTLAVIDVGAFALRNAYALNYDIVAGDAALLLDVGAAATGVTLVAGGQPLGTRELPRGGRSCVEALQRELGLGADDAGQLLRGRPAAGMTPEAAAPVLQPLHESLAAEVAGTRESFGAAAPPAGVGSLVLCGGASRAAGLADALAEKLQAEVVWLDPFRRLAVRGASGGPQRAEDRPLAAVAVGLALRRAGDR